MRLKLNRSRLVALMVIVAACLFSALTLFPANGQAALDCPALPTQRNPDDAARAAARLNPPPNSISLTADTAGLPLAADEIARQYSASSVLLSPDTPLTLQVSVPADGLYTFAFDAAVPDESAVPEAQLRVDGAFPAAGFEFFTLPVFYRSSSDDFPKDRYGNDAASPQERDVRWARTAVRDVNFSQPYPLQATLTAGEHRIELTVSSGLLYIGNFYLIPFAPYPDYADYLASQTAAETSGVAITLEAEAPTYKNETSVRAAASRSLTVTPYDTYCILLNTLGGESWIRSGSAAYYLVDAPQDGLYAITLRTMQNTRSNFTVFRRITVNGGVPFAQLNAVPFAYSADWVDVTLGGETPYRIFLHAGVNVLGVEATNAPYLTAINTIQETLLAINALALEIKQLTGNQRDVFKEWAISDYIPDIEERLNGITQRLIDDKDTLLSIDGSSTSPEALMYQMAIDNLLFLSDDPDQIPVYMSRFSEGTGSAAQQLGSLLPLLQNQPLALDTIIVHSPDIQPRTPSLPITTSMVEELKRFIYSFQPDPYQTVGANQGELEVWVNRSRQYVNLLQLMADSSFTPQTGIPVKFSLMPEEAKLILANAAGIEPDVALGVSTDRPYELAIRNALYDLRTFPGFDAYIRRFAPGSLLGYIIGDSVYAIPETQDFWVTYYREDILDSLGLPVPDTWDDVIQMLPELQRSGMNFNTLLSAGAGQRNYIFTSPYLFNYGAQLYSENGFATGLQSEEAIRAIRFMADSFTIYGMPLTTVNFYQDLRYGTLPAGVGNLTTYMQLTTAAPEIAGLWKIAPYPATVLEDGTRNRYTTGSAQTSIVFRDTDMPDAAWAFLQWWMSTETQVEFQEQLTLNYGLEYLWFSANLEAFSQLDIPEEHRDVILEQWQWLEEPVRLPGSYMQERELSNVWNRIVFDGVNPRVAIDRSVILINREIERKMEEFGYMQDGQIVREYRIPTVDTVRAWMENAD